MTSEGKCCAPVSYGVFSDASCRPDLIDYSFKVVSREDFDQRHVVLRAQSALSSISFLLGSIGFLASEEPDRSLVLLALVLDSDCPIGHVDVD